MGDLILTATGDLSRNARLASALGRGATWSRLFAELGHVAEGVRSAARRAGRARQFDVDMPITEAVCAVLDGALTPSEALHALLAREPKVEVLDCRDAAKPYACSAAHSRAGARSM
jgi:glycerol-3-phosphate dehydrogenase (NAD(P)+)